MERPWLRSYPEGIPPTIDDALNAFSSLPDLVGQMCTRYADKPAYVSFDVSLSYRRLWQQSQAFAGWLQEKGIQPGDRVALMMPNLLQYPVCLFGTLAAGAVVVNVNPLYTAGELAHQLKDSGARVIVVAEPFAHTVQAALPMASVEFVVVTGIGDMLGPVKGRLVNWVVRSIKRQIPAYDLPRAIAFPSTLHTAHPSRFTPPTITPLQLAFLQYTGGTTGKPKGVMLTHRNILANLCQAHAWINPWLHEGKERVITALPLYHIFALTANCLTFLRLGATNVLVVNPRDLPAFVKVLKKYPPTAITGVNTLFNALLNAKGINQVDFSGLKVSLGGGMAVQPAVAKRWKALTGCAIAQAYGLTETSPAVAINLLDGSEFNGSVGLPIPSTDIAIRDHTGQDLPVGQAGEVCINGPQVTPGYWQGDARKEGLFEPDGFLRSGDIGKLDERGFLYLLDRKKDMIIVSGFNVYPNEVEAVATEHPDIHEAAAIGVPDAHSGEAVLLYVISTNPSLTEHDVIAHCRQALTGYKVPRHVVFCDDLPRSNVGKVLRKELRKSYLQAHPQPPD
ncbi:MAG: AMP-binding protein [Burkholderiaceae bacterium]|jgi:long-chain acyl-CoA synthetase